MSLFYPNVSPNYVFPRNPDQYIQLIQTKIVKYNKVTLKEIPSYKHSIAVKKLEGTALNMVDTTPSSSNQFRVDFVTGDVFFHSAMEGEEIEISYTGTGQVNFGANKIIVNTSPTNEEEVTVQDILDTQEDIYTQVTDVKTTIERNQIVKLDDFNYLKDTTFQSPKEFTWISIANQDTFIIDTGKFTEKSLIDLSIGNVPQSSDNFILENEKTIKLLTPLPAGVKVYVKWSEGKKVVNNSVDVTGIYAELNKTNNNLYETATQLSIVERKKADQSDVETILAAVVSGAPKGFFNTLSSLQNAYPNGTDGIFLVLENGHIYLWINSSWQDAGVYQGIEVGNKTITANKLAAELKTTLGIDNVYPDTYFRKTLEQTISDTDYLIDLEKVGLITKISKGYELKVDTQSTTKTHLSEIKFGIVLNGDTISDGEHLNIGIKILRDSNFSSPVKIGIAFYDSSGNALTSHYLQKKESHYRLENQEIPLNAKTMNFTIQLDVRGFTTEFVDSFSFTELVINKGDGVGNPLGLAGRVKDLEDKSNFLGTTIFNRDSNGLLKTVTNDISSVEILRNANGYVTSMLKKWVNGKTQMTVINRDVNNIVTSIVTNEGESAL
ncbi:hypothetical protein CHH57_01490 [Niallia circulans]|uniref:Uncharacterized protein n=1 Tax=Niallia circulans TaxID=1397 RepID=A0AA91Z2Y4_NIACI|nr:hypothetical protein [Niallia circulans]PAD85011.1 hypothetical protein CHH57_01490 [Niallia circulans]